jgi:hypothetical protein
MGRGARRAEREAGGHEGSPYEDRLHNGRHPSRGHEKPGAVCRIASRVYPTCARIEKPISGQPEIGAQLASFNFLNSWICYSCQ